MNPLFDAECVLEGLVPKWEWFQPSTPVQSFAVMDLMICYDLGIRTGKKAFSLSDS